jgi:hypothetical protein
MLRYATIPALAAAVLIAGCGSSNTSSGSNGSGASAQSSGLAFAECMRSHGVPNFPDPTAGSGGGVQIQASQRAGSGQTMTVNGVPVSAPAFQSASQACNAKLPHGGKGPPGGITAIRAKALKMAQCMRSHGVPNFPDSPYGQKQLLSSSSGQAPAIQSAQTACRHLLPHGGQSQSQSQSPAHSQAQAAALLAFARCLRSHRFPHFPDPTSSGQVTHEMLATAGINLHQPAFLQAAEDCVGVTHGLLTKAAVARFVAGQ